jgi:hypothetical protein
MSTTTLPKRRVPLRVVAMPVEHGGWGLTLEPGLLGLLVAPGPASLALALAALLAFLLRTPVKIVLVDRWRGRQVERTGLAARVAAVELALLVLLVAIVAWLAVDATWWLPAIAAVPMLLVALSYDLRSRSRGLVPELVGSVAIASVAAMAAVAGGEAWPLAIGLWLVLGARIVTSIPHVRDQVSRLHGRSLSPVPTLVADVAAVAVAAVAVLVDGELLLGALGVAGIIVLQRLATARPPVRARVLGVRQMALGFGVVVLAAAGTWLP